MYVTLAPQVRLNLLSTLLHEAHAHLHNNLCASVLGRKLLLLPFHRDVALGLAGARAMRAAVEHCRRVGGFWPLPIGGIPGWLGQAWGGQTFGDCDA